MSEQFADAGGRYRLSDRIATGGMGVVWRGVDTMLHRDVAVKVLKAEYADDTAFRARFAEEARHAAALHHPNIAALYDTGETPATAVYPPRPFLVMELVEGQPLNHLIRPGAPMDADVVRFLMAQAADALGAAHRAGIVHRDVKPGNLLVTPDRTVKITDFGIARAAESVALTRTGQVMGTPQYLSPEQATGEPATPASDVYSLGVVTYECLAGRRPFDAESSVATALAHVRQPVPALPGIVPADLAHVVLRALAKDPAERYPDGDAFAAALRDPSGAASTGATRVAPPMPLGDQDSTQVLGAAPAGWEPEAGEGTRVLSTVPAADEPSTETPPGGRRREEESAPTNWWAVSAGLLVALLVIGGLIFWLSQSGDDEPDTPAPTTTQSPSPTETETTAGTVTINDRDFIGRQFEDVRGELQAQDLRVDGQQRTNPGGQTPGVVTSLSRSGTLETGTLVVVEFWGPEPEPEPEPTETTEPEPEPTETTEPEPEPTETTEPEPTQTTEPEPTVTPTQTQEPTTPTDGATRAPLEPAANQKGQP